MTRHKKGGPVRADDMYPLLTRALYGDNGHRYLSTGCLHLKHTQCRLTCKFCPARCVCDCHRKVEQVK